MSIEITKLSIKIGKKVVELTPEQAKELRQALDDLLGSEAKNEFHYHHSYIPPTIISPIIVERPYRWPWGHIEVTCETGTITADSASSFSGNTISYSNSDGINLSSSQN